MSECRTFRDVDGLKLRRVVRDAHFQERSGVAQFNRTRPQDSAESKHLHRLPFSRCACSTRAPDCKQQGIALPVVRQVTSTRRFQSPRPRFAGGGIGCIERTNGILSWDQLREGEVDRCIPRRMNRLARGFHVWLFQSCRAACAWSVLR